VRVAIVQVFNGPDGLAAANWPLRTALTDNEGHYRLSIPQGKFFLAAGRIDSPSFYPGTKSAAEARILNVTSGSAAQTLDFQLVDHPGVRVSGRLTTDGTIGIPKKITLIRSEPTFLWEEVAA